MPSPDSSDATSDPEVLAARGQVEFAKAELETRLYRAGETGRVALGRMARKARPVLVLTAVVVGVVLAARFVRAARRKSAWTRALEMPPPQNPSLLAVAAAGALRGVLRVVAARMTEQAAARLLAASEEHAEEEVELGR
jgi:hypothetical protein